MRFIFATGILIALCASAAAATAHHARSRVAHHGMFHSRQDPSGAWARFPAPGWPYQRPARPDRFDDTPSYDDPSKRGGA
ncbi:MAG: hypothetical protein JOY90_03120 [Bradyrhizobium sp.]|uniref:hypothetical protein n=1 Tax=Bradyrhizobium sp. TaxID=376 RepID=UPI001DD07CC3|nr:hypothetical protein [Bradyrhizobium sp.]MBV9559442.1 hypothetical protein [Bradyrhizobium sp.]